VGVVNNQLIWGSAVGWYLAILAGCGATSQSDKCGKQGCAGAASGGATATSGGKASAGGATATSGGKASAGGATATSGGATAASGGKASAGGVETCTADACGGAAGSGGAAAGAEAGDSSDSGAGGCAGADCTPDRMCVPGAKRCEHNDVYVCNESGSATRLLQDCNEAIEYCDVGTTKCSPLTCTPNSTWCTGSRLMLCNSSGTASSNTRDCAETGERCYMGECSAFPCTKNTSFCDGDNLVRCDSTGTETSLVRDCSSDNHQCVQDSLRAFCTECTPNAVTCQGASIATCSASGQWVATAPCPSGKLCRNAACVDRQCDEGFYCVGQEVRQCVDGVESQVVLKCTGNTTCYAGEALGCRRMLCDPGTPSCLGEGFGICATSGMWLNSGAESCSSKGQVCTPSGCASSALDTLGSASEAKHFEGGRIGNYLAVSSARTLTRIEAYLQVSGTAQATWQVFRHFEGTSNYSVEFSKTTTVSGTGFQDSGPLTQELLPNFNYFVTVYLNKSFEAFSSSISQSQLMSFGMAYEAVSGEGLTNDPGFEGEAGRLYAMRLTTAPTPQ